MLLSKGATIPGIYLVDRNCSHLKIYVGSAWKNYDEIYAENEHMKEMDDEARVWRVYNDESERIDFEIVEGWTSTLDTLFIFVSSTVSSVN